MKVIIYDVDLAKGRDQKEVKYICSWNHKVCCIKSTKHEKGTLLIPTNKKILSIEFNYQNSNTVRMTIGRP